MRTLSFASETPALLDTELSNRGIFFLLPVFLWQSRIKTGSVFFRINMKLINLKKELYRAVQQTRLTVQKKKHYLEIPQTVNRLAEQIISRTYQPSQYNCFAISDPTPREILAPSYPDRIVHRWLVNKMEPFIDKRLLPCSYANRKGKGHHRAVKQLRFYLNNSANKYYLKSDIRSFFNSIDHRLLLAVVGRWINKLPYCKEEKETLMFLSETIITHNPTEKVLFTGNKNKLKAIPRHKSYFYNPQGKGLPLGNLTSQFFANIYLHELDWFVKHQLHVRYYLRYVDDVVLLAETTAQLKEWQNTISDFLKEELKLHLHLKKTILQPTRYGIDFLGYIIRCDYILVRRRVVKNFKRKLYFYNHLLNNSDRVQNPVRVNYNGNGKIEKLCRTHELTVPIKPNRSLLLSMQSSLNSYYGIFRFADTHHLRKELYLHRFGTLQKYFYANNRFHKTGLLKKR